MKLETKGGINMVEEQVFSDSLTKATFIRTRLQELYQLGYLDPIQSVVHQSIDSLWLSVDTGKKFEWVTLRQGNVESVVLVKVGADMKRFNQKSFDYRQVYRLFESIIKESENKGYPFAAVKLDSLEREGNKFSAALNLDLLSLLIP